MHKRTIAILLFDDVEVLDFAGPFEVFSATNEKSGYSFMNIYTVAAEKRAIIAKNGLSVNPDYGLAEAPKPDLLIIPGGDGSRKVLQQPDVISWIIENAKTAEKVMSVCSGALLLAKAGLLDGLKATTHFEVLETLAEVGPKIEILKDVRFTDNGKILTSAGVSAGIDMSLYVIGLLYGKETARITAKYIEYDYKEQDMDEFV